MQATNNAAAEKPRSTVAAWLLGIVGLVLLLGLVHRVNVSLERLDARLSALEQKSGQTQLQKEVISAVQAQHLKQLPGTDKAGTLSAPQKSSGEIARKQ